MKAVSFTTLLFVSIRIFKIRQKFSTMWQNILTKIIIKTVTAKFKKWDSIGLFVRIKNTLDFKRIIPKSVTKFGEDYRGEQLTNIKGCYQLKLTQKNFKKRWLVYFFAFQNIKKL